MLRLRISLVLALVVITAAVAAADETERALVLLEDGVDVKALDASLHAQRTDLATRHATVIETLQRTATDTQADLLADLERRQRSGEVVRYRPFWILNTVAVTGTAAALAEIAARPDVARVEPDRTVELIAPISARSAGRGIGTAPGVVAVGARRVWDELGIHGEGALVANLDTGVDRDHPALADRWRGLFAPVSECWLDFIGTGPLPTDTIGHGTHVMGTLCGLAADDSIGVAPGAQWIASNIIAQDVGTAFNSDVLIALEWVADPDGDPSTVDDMPDVVQNSWGVYEGLGYPDCYGLWWNAIDACEAAGVVLTWSAGNEGPDPGTVRSPADRAHSPVNCFSVGSTQIAAPHYISTFSSRGPAASGCGSGDNLVKPELVAPGADIYSAVPGGGYEFKSGTSMAGPHVAGVVALMRSANPDVDVVTIKEVLLLTAHDLGPAGDDNDYGHGFVDAYAAVMAVMEGVGIIDGTVVDDVTSLPIAGATVSIAGGFHTVVTAADGGFRLVAGAGPRALTVTAFGYVDRIEPVVVIEDEMLTVTVRLDPAPTVTVSGIVHLPGDMGPAPGAEITVVDTPLSPVVADAAGSYELPVPAAAAYRLRVASGTIAGLEQTVPASQDLDLDLFLQPVTTDDFETGDLGALPWTTGGGADWFVQTAEAHGGLYAARSGAIGHGEVSDLDLAVDCGDGGEVSFWLKVSSQPTWDLLRFYVDGYLRDQWAGEVGWTRYATVVPAGSHDFRWRYWKSPNGTSGADATWLDDVEFPSAGVGGPRLVAAPTVVEVILPVPGQTTAPAFLLDQGDEDLVWSTSESTDWLVVTPASGAVPAGDFTALSFAFDAVGLPAGVHTALVQLASNDPATPLTILTARLTLEDDAIGVQDPPPTAFALRGAVPNPFNPATVIRYTLARSHRAALQVFDVRGRLVRTLFDADRPAGSGEARWDGRDERGQAVASGTYFARLRSGSDAAVARLSLVR